MSRIKQLEIALEHLINRAVYVCAHRYGAKDPVGTRIMAIEDLRTEMHRAAAVLGKKRQAMTPAEVIAQCGRISSLSDKAQAGPWLVENWDNLTLRWLHSSAGKPDADLIAELRNTGPALARALRLAVKALSDITGTYPTNGVARRALAAIGAEFER